MKNDYTFCFFVEYIENGVECADCWSERTLNEELNRNEVKITHVSLAYNVEVALGIIEE